MVFAFLLTCPGCDGNPAPPPAGAERFTDYYAEEMFLVEQTRLEGSDSLDVRRRLDSLRSLYAISAAGRDSMVRYYQDSLPRWESFLTEVLHRLEERERRVGKGTAAGSGASARTGGTTGPGTGAPRN